MNNKLTVVTMVNNEVLYFQLKKSLEQQRSCNYFDFISINADKKEWGAAKALNYGIDKSKTEWIVFVHQDVVFPHQWIVKVESCLNKISEKVAVIGLVGVRNNGSYVGHIKDPHGHAKWGSFPASVVSIDEHLIILRKSSGIRFDESFAGFHCYGTDICLTARSCNLETIVIDAPVVHLSAGNIKDESFKKAADWLLDKWGKDMNNVLPTCADIIYKTTIFNLLRLFMIKLKRRIRGDSLYFMCDCKDVDL